MILLSKPSNAESVYLVCTFASIDASTKIARLFELVENDNTVAEVDLEMLGEYNHGQEI